MGAYDQYNLRIESLIMEERTRFDEELRDLSEDDRRWLSGALHEDPRRATRLRYIRHHTGFCREILATRRDVEHLYRERILKSTAPGAIPSHEPDDSPRRAQRT